MPERVFRKEGIQSLIEVFIWVLIVVISLFISEYVAFKVGLVDEFIKILLAAIIISIFVQIVRSHNHGEGLNGTWFFFYFLVYTTAVWVMRDFVLVEFGIGNNFGAFALTGLAISLIMFSIEKTGIRSRTIPWISFALIIVLSVSYYSHFTGAGLGNFGTSFTKIEEEEECPIPILPSTGLQQFEQDFSDNSVPSRLNAALDGNIWKVENGFSTCYQGKYAGQRPDWVYCEGMIASRWATGSAGTINYRWYTAVVAEWKPEKLSTNTVYSLNGFSCENGKKLTVDKETKDYYVHVARDGSQIKIEY